MSPLKTTICILHKICLIISDNVFHIGWTTNIIFIIAQVAKASVSKQWQVISLTSLYVIPNLYSEIYFIYNTAGLKFPKKVFKVSQVLKARGFHFLVDGACNSFDQDEADNRVS